MRNTKIVILLFFFVLSSTSMIAQSGDLDIGFELGWIYSKLDGPSEINDQGDKLESYDFNAGFHLLVFAKYHFTDQFGLQGGLQYAKRGSKYEFNGDSWFLFGAQTNKPAFGFGERIEGTEYNNAYIDLPITAFYKISPSFEVGAGLYVGALISSKGTGEIRFSGVSSSGRPLDPPSFNVGVDYNYGKDNFGIIHTPFQEIIVNNTPYQVPRFATTYYDFMEDPGDEAFNTFDAGLIAQLGYYFNRRLNLKAKLQYGLTDVTNDDFDRSKFRLTGNNNTFIFRSDKDTNISFQISLGLTL